MVSATNSRPSFFAVVFDRLSNIIEKWVMGDIRRGVAGCLQGRVLEIGCGPGATFAHYGEKVTEIVATEPDAYLRERARKRAAGLGRPVEVHSAAAEALPFEEASFDHVISICVLCSVQDLKGSLLEIQRVLRPGGAFHFYEHVRNPSPVIAFFQDALTPVWRVVAGGCEPNRDIRAAMVAAGFKLRELECVAPVPPIPPLNIIRHHIRGTAVKA